jgi:hypothetical protein
MAMARFPARDHARQPQIGAAIGGLREVVVFAGVCFASGLISDQGGMQCIDSAEALAIEQGPKRRESGVRVAGALLRPRHQQGLQQLRQALMRQCGELMLRGLPMSGPDIGFPEQ